MLRAWLGSKSGIPPDNGIYSFVLASTPQERGGEGENRRGSVVRAAWPTTATQPWVCPRDTVQVSSANTGLSLLLGFLCESESISPSPLFILLHFSYSISLKWNMIKLLAAVFLPGRWYQTSPHIIQIVFYRWKLNLGGNDGQVQNTGRMYKCFLHCIGS